jgi:hypothetical protein
MGMINQFEPVNIDGISTIKLNNTITNNDPGAIYNSGTYFAVDSLPNDILGLPGNETYTSVSDLLAEWTANVRAPPTGEVYNGWSADFNNNGQVNLTNNGFFFDQWLSTQSSPNLDTMALGATIPNHQLDGADGVWGSGLDYHIALGPQMENAFTAYTTTGFEIPAPGQAYEIHQVPEPGSAALVMAGLGSALAGKKLREAGRAVKNRCRRWLSGSAPASA